eukprot:10824538-Heterocapsa_arctica.AAC.1
MTTTTTTSTSTSMPATATTYLTRRGGALTRTAVGNLTPTEAVWGSSATRRRMRFRSHLSLAAPA